jgi:hypothetical protein
MFGKTAICFDRLLIIIMWQSVKMKVVKFVILIFTAEDWIQPQ